MADFEKQLAEMQAQLDALRKQSPSNKLSIIAFSGDLDKALAAYNAGVGHMLDARNLARKMDLDPNRWASMVIALPLLSQYRYFQDTIYGYYYGKQPLKYVRRIRSYFDILNYHHPEP